MNESTFETPILFLIFNRPETTMEVFNKIKQVKPSKLYVGADGPRKNRADDRELCQQTRDILRQINWKCEVHKLFREENLGCAKAISQAVTWFFDNEDMGIILEDDCVPHPDFFPYCQEMLIRYRNEARIMFISGTNFISNIKKPETSYYFSRLADVWGWASWKRAWAKYDLSIQDWPIGSQKLLNDSYFHGFREYREILMYSLDNLYEVENPNTWDYQWAYCILMNDGLCVVPRENLISNIGVNGVHFNDGNTLGLGMKTTCLNLSDLSSILKIEPDYELDSVKFREQIRIGSGYYYSMKLGSWLRKVKFLPYFKNFHPFRIGLLLKGIIKK